MIHGKNYIFRTVTMIYTGVFSQEEEEFFIIRKAAWVADTGRWADCLVTCEFKEVEPYPPGKPVFIYKSGLLDIVEIEKLPLEQK